MAPATRKNDGWLFCPMCGATNLVSSVTCKACGESIPIMAPVDVARDRAIAIGVGMITALICGYWILSAVPVLGVPRTISEEITVIFAGLITLWLWGPPLFVSAIYRPADVTRGTAVSRYRVFWQTQSLMYALSIGLHLLCLGICTAPGIGR